MRSTLEHIWGHLKAVPQTGALNIEEADFIWILETGLCVMTWETCLTHEHWVLHTLTRTHGKSWKTVQHTVRHLLCKSSAAGQIRTKRMKTDLQTDYCQTDCLFSILVLNQQSNHSHSLTCPQDNITSRKETSSYQMKYFNIHRLQIKEQKSSFIAEEEIVTPFMCRVLRVSSVLGKTITWYIIHFSVTL